MFIYLMWTTMRRCSLAKHAVFQIVVKWTLEDTCAVNNSKLRRWFFLFNWHEHTFFNRNVPLETRNSNETALSNRNRHRISNEKQQHSSEKKQKHVKIYVKTAMCTVCNADLTLQSTPDTCCMPSRHRLLKKPYFSSFFSFVLCYQTNS